MDQFIAPTKIVLNSSSVICRLTWPSTDCFEIFMASLISLGSSNFKCHFKEFSGYLTLFGYMILALTLYIIYKF